MLALIDKHDDRVVLAMLVHVRGRQVKQHDDRAVLHTPASVTGK